MQTGLITVVVAQNAGTGAEIAIHKSVQGKASASGQGWRRRLPFEALAINGSQRVIGDNFFSAPRGTIPGAGVPSLLHFVATGGGLPIRPGGCPLDGVT